MQGLLQKLLQRKLLLLSLLVNLILVLVCLVLFAELRKSYANYRHFRALSVGISEATSAEPTTDKTIVLYGDSRMKIWHPAPESDKYRFVNAGIAGETTSEMRRRFERDVLRLQPDLVIIQAGVNDLTAVVTRGISNPEALITAMHDNLTYFTATLEEQGIDVIITSIIPPKPLNLIRRAFWKDNLTARVNDTNLWLKQTALKLNADWFDLDPLYRDESGKLLDNLYVDSLHISYDGYRVLNEHLSKYLENY